MNKFKAGDRVKYVSGAYYTSESNPLWIDDEPRTHIAGTVSSFYIDRYRVNWDNGHSNGYLENDLRLLAPNPIEALFKN